MLVVDRHKYENQKYYYNRAITLPYATNSTMTIANAAIAILKELHEGNEGLQFKKAGVIVTQFIDEDKKQFQLFEEENPKHLALMKAMDSLNTKIGNRKVKLASQDLKVTWNMKQNHLSPNYQFAFFCNFYGLVTRIFRH